MDFINSHLTADKLFPVNPRAITGAPKISLLLKANLMPELIISTTLVAHTDDLGLNKTSNQHSKCLFKTSTGLSADQMLRQSRFCIATQTVFQLTWCFWKIFVLTHNFGTGWALATERRDLSYIWMLQQQTVLGPEHQSSLGQVFHHMHGSGRQPTDHNQTLLRSPWQQHHDNLWL